MGSYLKRNPHVRREHRFNTLVVEFFLKTNGGEFRGIKFLKDDPYIGAYSIQGLSTYRPDMPVNLADASAIHVGADTIYAKDKDVCHPFKLMEEIARKVFLVVEKAWDIQDCTLCDLKIEFGHTTKGELVVADVIDNDSWRLFDDRRRHLDKQRYRDGAEISEVESLYKNVAERTTRFGEQPFKCDIVLWCASEKDDPRPFFDELKKYGLTTSLIHLVRSVHKAPEESLLMLRSALADRKYAVIITYVGRSNGAGPVIQGDTHFPVIGVPANWKDCPEDVWSSLRMPSDIPMTTVLDPANAIQAALGMLSMHNPVAYLARRSIVENQKLARGNSPTHAMNF